MTQAATTARQISGYYSTEPQLSPSVVDVWARPLSIMHMGTVAAVAAASLASTSAPPMAKASHELKAPTREPFPNLGHAYQASSVRHSVADALIQRVRELGAYSTGWHSDGSQAATQPTIEQAERFIRSISWDHYIPPVIALAEDGEMNLVWTDESRHVDIGFFGDGTYAYYAKGKDGSTFYEDAAPYQKPLAPEVLGLIAKETA